MSTTQLFFTLLLLPFIMTQTFTVETNMIGKTGSDACPAQNGTSCTVDAGECTVCDNIPVLINLNGSKLVFCRWVVNETNCGGQVSQCKEVSGNWTDQTVSCFRDMNDRRWLIEKAGINMIIVYVIIACAVGLVLIGGIVLFCVLSGSKKGYRDI